jgi:capsular polysaccharide transport system permease protein
MDDAPSSRADRLTADKQAAALAVLGPELDAARPAANPGPLVFQYRVLKALVLREMAARHGESRLGYLMSIILPLFTMGLLMVAFSLRGKTIPTDFSLGAFVVTGYPLWQAFQGMYTRVVGRASSSDPLLMFPQITQLDLILSTIILETATNTVVFVLLIIGVLVIFQEAVPADPVGVVLIYWACGWIGSGLGMVLCGLNRIVPTVVVVINTFLRFGMWMSGVIFSVNRLPPVLWPYLKWNPILHCTEGARHLWKPTFEAPIFDPVYIISCGVVLTTLGFIVERSTRRFVGP